MWPSETASTPLEYVPKFTRIACVLQCGGIWFAAGRFGVTWKLFQAVVKPPQSLRGTCHIEVSDTDREIMSANDSKAGAGAHSNASNDEDDDDGAYATNQSVSSSSSVASAAVADDSDGENESKQSPPTTTATSASVVVSDEAPSSDTKRKVVVRKKKTGSD